MAIDSNVVEQAVSRALRDNLERIKHTSEELHQAVNDIISACASSRPTNALPPMLRAQVSAASLSAVLEVLSRFVTIALQPTLRSPAEQEIWRVISTAVLEETAVSDPAAASERPEAIPPHLTEENPLTAPEAEDLPPGEETTMIGEAQPPGEPVPVFAPESIEPVIAPLPEMAHHLINSPYEEARPEAEPGFNLASLPADQQELHRRAYRVAKVSMQDIKMLRPEDVRLGRENKDLCSRLRDDIEKAHREYDRRFQPILSHPVDYFYDWMVEILAGGNSEALGEYPYPSAVLHR